MRKSPDKAEDHSLPDENGAKSPLGIYLAELNQAPLLTRQQEVSLGEKRDASVRMNLEIASILEPHVLAHCDSGDSIGLALEESIQELSSIIVEEYKSIADQTDTDQSGGGSKATIADAHHALGEIMQAAKVKTETRHQPTDQKALLKVLFVLLRKIEQLTNKICTSNFNTAIPALVSILRRTPDILSAAFPPEHDASKQAAVLRGELWNKDDEEQGIGELAEACGITHINGNTAREILIRSNLRLVVNVARRFIGRNVDLEDLIEEGNMGLIRAAEGFDPSRGTKFSTYATPWIEQCIKRCIINDSRTIRLPAYINALMGKWQFTKDRLHTELGYEPDFDQIAEALGIQKERQRLLVKQALQIGVAVTSNEENSWMPANDSAVDPQPSIDATLIHHETLEYLPTLLDQLDEDSRTIIELRFGLREEEPKTLREVGEITGLTREWVRQLEGKALEKMGVILREQENK